MILMIDNYDSFVYNLVQYIEELGETVVVKRNNEIKISDIEELNPEVIVLSPGPCSPKEAGICIDIVEHFKGKKPILGICLGHQTIGHVFGGDIIKAQQPVHGKVYSINHTDKGEIMGIRHKKYLIEGVQFHPEAILSEYGHEMLKNFITEARERVHV